MRQFSESESALRSRARHLGYRMVKSRRGESIDNCGGFMLVDLKTNFAAAGFRYDLQLMDVASFLGDEA